MGYVQFWLRKSKTYIAYVYARRARRPCEFDLWLESRTTAASSREWGITKQGQGATLSPEKNIH